MGVSLTSGALADVGDEVYRRKIRVNVDGVVFGVRAAQRAVGARGGRDLQAVRYPFIPVDEVAAVVHDVVERAEHGRAWVLQPGLAPWVEAAPELAGPRLETWRRPGA